jgi:hypothetical protein
MCRFNLTVGELRATLLEGWAQERWVELGERKWNPNQATLTVIEGPRIPLNQLTMGRGWRTAQRDGREVTEELLEVVTRELAEAQAAGAPSGGARVAARPPSAGADDAEALAADSLGLELLSRIGVEAVPLARAWELAVERHPDSPPSATLALAERAVESLLRGQLVVLLRGGGGAGDAQPVMGEAVGEELGRIASWAGAGADAGVWMRRA